MGIALILFWGKIISMQGLHLCRCITYLESEKKRFYKNYSKQYLNLSTVINEITVYYTPQNIFQR